ncbi:MAG: IS1595 family transposase [Acidobacteriota bacterium]
MRPEDRDAAHFWDVIEAGEAIALYVAAKTFDDYLADSMLRAAVERQLPVLGEATKRMSEAFRGAHPEIGWRSIIGWVVARVIDNTDAATLQGFVNEAVSDRVKLVATDDHPGYVGMDRPHDSVKHSAHEYVRGNVYTASIDSFWALIKRGIMGSYHQVSKDYLPLYLAEFSFRHNARKDPDMFERVIRQA